jgi:hypothetical protein
VVGRHEPGHQPARERRRTCGLVGGNRVLLLCPVKGSAESDGVPVLGAVKIVRPVGRCILTAPVRRLIWRRRRNRGVMRPPARFGSWR